MTGHRGLAYVHDHRSSATSSIAESRPLTSIRAAFLTSCSALLTTLPEAFLASSISSESVNLQQFLVSRLRQRLETLGSMIYRLTWKEAATPQQWQYYRLAAWAHRTSENECFSWATPLYSYGIGSAGKGKKELPNQAKLVPWSTPTTQDNNQVAGQGKAALHPKRGTTLGGAARQCIAETTSVGKYQLNPRFSLWLMGYPIEWAYCGEVVTQSSRKSQQK